MISLKKTYTFLFFLGMFFIPFNSSEGISFLGEFKREGAIIFFLLCVLFLTIDAIFKKRIKIPINNNGFQLTILFCGIILISGIINIESIYSNYMKNTLGITRYIKQVVSLAISFSIFLAAINVVKHYNTNTIFFKIRKIFSYSLWVVTSYSLIEILIIKHNVYFLKQIIHLFDYLPFIDVYLDFTHRRISSICQEPPFLAMYLITISGWMFSYILSEKKIKRFIPAIIVLSLTFYSGSRTALIVVVIQFLIFLTYSFSVSKKLKQIIINASALTFLLVILVSIVNFKAISTVVSEKMNSISFTKNLDKNVSNKSRLGIQYTSLLIFKENPIFGVGFGQQAYHASTKYPKWATSNNYEFSEYYLNENYPSFPPGYNIYVRILAELGIIGFLLFILLNIYLILQARKLILKRKGIHKFLAITLIVSFYGYTINWLQFDSFRLFGFWICFALLIKLTNEK